MSTDTLYLAHCRKCLRESSSIVVLKATDDPEEAKEWNHGKRELAHDCVVCGTKEPGAMRPDDVFFLDMMSGAEDERDDYGQ